MGACAMDPSKDSSSAGAVAKVSQYPGVPDNAWDNTIEALFKHNIHERLSHLTGDEHRNVYLHTMLTKFSEIKDTEVEACEASISSKGRWHGFYVLSTLGSLTGLYFSENKFARAGYIAGALLSSYLTGKQRERIKQLQRKESALIGTFSTPHFLRWAKKDKGAGKWNDMHEFIVNQAKKAVNDN